MATGVLVDGAFFLRRFKHSFPKFDSTDAKSIAFGLSWLVHWHIVLRVGPKQIISSVDEHLIIAETPALYRIFFYDCPPLEKRMHQPLSKRSINFGKTEEAVFRLSVHSELQKLRKMALRLGRLNDTSTWRLSEEATKRLILNPISFTPIDEDFEIDTKQKGVDMRLGLDVASLAFKKQVDQIIIVAADADFVPAAKLARREGIDVILDRMGANNAANDLIEHVDGIRDCYCSDPYRSKNSI
jgi:uncharacterized LabA/DUF88 family protein